MVLFRFCKKYILKKLDNHCNAYTTGKLKIECKETIENATSYAVLKDSIRFCQNNQVHSIANYTIIVKFCIYSVGTDFPYFHKSFDQEFVSDFFWIQTCNKKMSTKTFYSNLIISFVSEFNAYIHKDSREIKLYSCKEQYSAYGGLTERLENNEIKKVLQKVQTKKPKFQLMVHLLLRTGIRVSELLNIKKKDIYEIDEYYVINIKGKGSRYRIVSIKNEFIEPFYEGLILHLEQDEYIFMTINKKQISRKYVYSQIQKFFFDLGILKSQNGPHVLRHTFASKMYEKHKDIILLQEFIGHVNIETTRKYVHLNRVCLRELANVFDDIVKTAITEQTEVEVETS